MSENRIVWHEYPKEPPPKEGEKYLVTYNALFTGKLCVGVFRFFADEFTNVIAWAELPKHYKKSSGWIKRLVAEIPFTLYGYECPFCKFRTATDSFRYCPNCGEKMEVDE